MSNSALVLVGLRVSFLHCEAEVFIGKVLHDAAGGFPGTCIVYDLLCWLVRSFQLWLLGILAFFSLHRYNRIEAGSDSLEHAAISEGL